MKLITLLSLIIVFLTNDLFVHAKEVTLNYNIKGMMCKMNCPGYIKEAAIKVDGVKKCDVDFSTSSATITFDDTKVDKDKLASILVDNTDNLYDIKIENKDLNQSWWDWLFGI